VLLISAPAVNAELHDRGNGLIYDDVLNITWLQDANYAASEINETRAQEIIYAVGSIDDHILTLSDFHDYDSSGGSYNGKMSWYGSLAWADQLVYGGYDDWRLPKDGSQIGGGELGHMYYENLPLYSSLIYNLVENYYWSSDEYYPYPPDTDTPYAFMFYFNTQSGGPHERIFTYKDNVVWAWAVRDGDVIPIILYAWGWSSTGGGLVTIDIVTGEVTLAIEASDRQVEALAYDSANKTLYGVEQKWGVEENVLIKIDINNGTISDIGPVGFNEVTAMTFDETTGTIYALDQTTRTLFQIDPTTGGSTTIGNFSHGASNGLAAHPITGELFASVFVDPGYLAKIDKNTGSSTLVGSFGDCLVSALSFYPQSSVLYGKAGGPAGGPFADGRLVRIDITTGLATPIGSSIGNINAFAFVTMDTVPSFSCSGFKPPCDKIISIKNKNRSIPLRTELLDSEGLPITDADIQSPPIIEFSFESNIPAPSDTTVYNGLPPAEATDGNEFIYEDGEWHLNIKIRDYDEGAGTYTFTMESGNVSEYLIESANNTVTVVLEK
jgi:hypothetical protein